MNTILCTVDQLAKSYGKQRGISQISFTLQAGQAIGLLGANGAGKSTLIKCLLGLVHASQGTVSFHGTAPAYLPEQPQLPVSLSAHAILQFKCSSNGLPATMAETALQAVNLSEQAWHQPVRQYSKGMRQRTALALSLCGDPAILLLDEPMSGLDALGRSEMLQLFKQRKIQGAAFLMSSHIVSDMVQLCDHVLIMAHGKICQRIEITQHSLEEAKLLEQRLAYWTARNDLIQDNLIQNDTTATDMGQSTRDKQHE